MNVNSSLTHTQMHRSLVRWHHQLQTEETREDVYLNTDQVQNTWFKTRMWPLTTTLTFMCMMEVNSALYMTAGTCDTIIDCLIFSIFFYFKTWRTFTAHVCHFNQNCLTVLLDAHWENTTGKSYSTSSWTPCNAGGRAGGRCGNNPPYRLHVKSMFGSPKQKKHILFICYLTRTNFLRLNNSILEYTNRYPSFYVRKTKLVFRTIIFKYKNQRQYTTSMCVNMKSPPTKTDPQSGFPRQTGWWDNPTASGGLAEWHCAISMATCPS